MVIDSNVFKISSTGLLKIQTSDKRLLLKLEVGTKPERNRNKFVNSSYWLRSGYTCDPFFVVERILVSNVYLIAALMAVERESMALGVVVLIAFKTVISKIDDKKWTLLSQIRWISVPVHLAL